MGEDNFFFFAKNYTDFNQWKNYTVYCLESLILDVTFLISEKIYTVYYLDYHKAYCGSLKVIWETFAVSLSDWSNLERNYRFDA